MGSENCGPSVCDNRLTDILMEEYIHLYKDFIAKSMYLRQG